MRGPFDRSAWAPGLCVKVALLALTCSGCEAKCREPPPISELHAQVRERVDDLLDEVDATPAQAKTARAAFDATLPALQRYRQETLPRQRLGMAELESDAPDREQLGRLIDESVAAWRIYARAVIDATLASHAAFDAEQRRAMAEKAGAERRDRFEGGFLFDRAFDYLLMRIDGTPEQSKLLMRIKGELSARGKVLNRQSDALRKEAFAELASERPNRARLDATLDLGADLMKKLFRDLAGYYLLFASKLTPRQRVLLKAEMIRFEPCPEPAKGGSASVSAASAPGA